MTKNQSYEKGENNQSEIASILQVDNSIVIRDVAYIRQQSKNKE